MSTFASLYAPIRTLLGDTGLVALYSNDQLDMGIFGALLADSADGGPYSEGTPSGAARTITPDIPTYKETYKLALRAAIALIAPSNGVKSYRTATLSVTRDTASGGLLAWLNGQLRLVKDGNFTVDSDTEWDVFLRGTAAAVAKFSGFPG